jgi:hypothetical protein
MTKLLALDLSGDIGWAMFQAPGPPRFGTLSWRGQGILRIAGQFGDWLDDLYSIDPWDAMAWEAPWLQPGDKVDKMKILIGLPAICYRFAGSARHPMPHAEVMPKELKKRMTGRQDAKKTDVIEACWDLGWKVKNDHEADACGVGLVAYRRIFPKREAA